MSVRYNYALQKNEVYQAFSYYYTRTGTGKYRWIIAALFVGLGAWLYASKGQSSGAFIWFLGAVFIATSPYLNAFFSLSRYFSRRRASNAEQFEFDNSGVKYKSRGGNSKANWGAFTRWIEAPQAFILIIRRTSIVLLSKHGFESDAKIEEFRSLLKRGIGDPS